MDYEEFPYVSCIQIGRRPILPPLMTDDRKTEMRYYRELAVALEKHLKLRKAKRLSIDSGVMVSGSDGSIGKKAAETMKSEVIINVDESFTTVDGCAMEHKTPTRIRRNSYTLEAPSPVMLEFMRANEKYDKLLIDMADSSDASTVVNDEEIPMSVPVEEFSTDGMEKLTLEDLEKSSEPGNSPKMWDFEQFVTHAQRAKSFSLPNTSQSTPVCPPKTSASSCCLKIEYENLVKNKPPANSAKNDPIVEHDSFIELHKLETRSITNKDHFYINDSFTKYADLLDFNNSANMSLESELCGRDSMYSDCSSVSLSKFLIDTKTAENQESTPLSNYLHMKEQLELKHRNELIKLLREQEKENNLLDQLIRVSNTSSPKSNYAYSKDVVLKKYSTENSPSPILPKYSSDDGSQRPGKTLSCCRRICNEESRKSNHENSDVVPAMRTETFVNNEKPEDYEVHARAASKINAGETFVNNEKIEDYEVRARAATKINAAVRGYFVRRLFKTSRIQVLLQTINDCLITAISLQKESDLKAAELSLQSRVLQQSITAQNEILEIFALPTKKQLEIISADRELKSRSLLRKSRATLPLSEATRKTIERRKSMNYGSRATKNVVRKRCKSAITVRSDSNMKCQNTPNNGKTRTKLSQNYTVPRPTRRSWR